MRKLIPLMTTVTAGFTSPLSLYRSPTANRQSSLPTKSGQRFASWSLPLFSIVHAGSLLKDQLAIEFDRAFPNFAKNFFKYLIADLLQKSGAPSEAIPHTVWAALDKVILPFRSALYTQSGKKLVSIAQSELGLLQNKYVKKHYNHWPCDTLEIAFSHHFADNLCFLCTAFELQTFANMIFLCMSFGAQHGERTVRTPTVIAHRVWTVRRRGQT